MAFAAQNPGSDDRLLVQTESIWNQVKQSLSSEFGETRFNNWLVSLKFKGFFSGRIVITAPNRFIRDWVQRNCADRIFELLNTADAKIMALDLVVDSSQQQTKTPPTSKMTDMASANVISDSSPESYDVNDSDGKEIQGSRLEPRYKFESFVVGKSNELAFAAAKRVAESNTVTFNPLFLYGSSGLGKTHLMQAIAWEIKTSHPERSVMYLSAEKFMYLFIRALRFRDTVSFKDQFRSVDVLMIDDFQFIGGKDSTQEEFFHTFNALMDQNHQIIISADKPPSDLVGLEERMRSRLGWGLVADIHPTTYELRLGILDAKAEMLKTTFPRKVLEFLALKITSNIRELEGALNRIVAHSMLVGREITLESTQDVLRDLLRSSNRQLSVDEIQKKVAEYYKIKLADMHSSDRSRNVARPRQVAMCLAKQLTTLSLPDIGRKFGGRDHTTVIHAIKKIEELKDSEVSLAEDLDLLKRMLES